MKLEIEQSYWLNRRARQQQYEHPWARTQKQGCFYIIVEKAWNQLQMIRQSFLKTSDKVPSEELYWWDGPDRLGSWSQQKCAFLIKISQQSCCEAAIFLRSAFPEQRYHCWLKLLPQKALREVLSFKSSFDWCYIQCTYFLACLWSLSEGFKWINLLGGIQTLPEKLQIHRRMKPSRNRACETSHKCNWIQKVIWQGKGV